MTQTPGGSGQPPEEQPQPQQPGPEEQQAQPSPPPGYPPAYDPGYDPGYGQGYGQAYGQGPVRYAPDHPRATTALVLGILGIVMCQVLAPFAWVIGKRTVDEIDASRGTLGGRGPAHAGYVLGVVGSILLGLAVLGLLIALALFVILAATDTTHTTF